VCYSAIKNYYLSEDEIMSIDVQQVLEEKMKKSISVLKEELNTVRAGRANPALLDKIMVDYYGSPTPLKNISNISVPDPRSLMISPFDPKSIHDIEKAINIANLGINPSNDGKVIRLVIPAVTEERRKELIKVVKKYGEDAKVAVRNERRDANDELKKQEKTGEITEDDLKKSLDDVQKKTDKAIKDIDTIVADKEKEIMEV
jgi:ribosome recycling factor